MYATRYKRSFPFLPVNDSRYPTVDDANTCGIYRDIKDGIAYIGFVRPTLRKCQYLGSLHHVREQTSNSRVRTGAIPPLAELQAQRWIHDLVRCPKYQHLFSPSFQPSSRSHPAVPPYELDYKIHCRDAQHDFANTKLAVDHESYAFYGTDLAGRC